MQLLLYTYDSLCSTYYSKASLQLGLVPAYYSAPCQRYYNQFTVSSNL